MLRSPCPMVVTVHDLAALKRRSEHLRTGVRLRLRHLAVQRAMRVIVPTQAVADDAVEQLGRRARAGRRDPPRRPIRVMYPRAASRRSPGAPRATGCPSDYLVWVAALQHPDPRKHVARAGRDPARAAAGAGRPTRPWAHELPEVILTGNVSDERAGGDLQRRARARAALRDEGFGLPAVEALACGTPVVACDAPALREVLGERATFVERATWRPGRRGRSAAARAGAAAWSWADAARATWGVYAERRGQRRRRVPARSAPAAGRRRPAGSRLERSVGAAAR